jgi:uncharacterized membrane protein YdjX (TVP38/TMEM64 family)
MTKRVVLVSALAIVILVGAVPPARYALVHSVALLATGQFAQFQHYLQSLGAWAPVVSIALMTVEAVAIPIPVTIIMVANGLVFGLWAGMLVSLVGGITGALLAYAIGRRLGRALVAQFLPASSLRTADRLMAKYGGWAVVFERWIPGVPGDPVSYAAGITRMPVPAFLGLTILGLVPANLVTAFVGVNVADDVPMRYWVTGIATLGAVWGIWRIIRRRRRVNS